MPLLQFCSDKEDDMGIPEYLREYEALYERDPREAAKRCFADAKYALFLH